MKKFLFVLLTASFLVVGCSDFEVEVKQKTTKADSSDHPFEVYSHIDEDGCEYLIVYEERGFYPENAGGLGLGITAKVNQPSKCGQNE